MSTALNPFLYGALARDEAFTDREREIAELTSDILNGQDVVIFAPRRYGKSSLVWRVQQELVKKRVLVAHVDLMTAPTKEKLAEKLAKTIHEDIASVVYRARQAALEVFRGLRVAPTITIDPDNASVSFGFETGRAREDVDATLERLLALPGELAADRRRKVALVLDEFQEIVELDPQLPKLMRAVFQTQPEVSHVYLGSRRHMMRRIFSDENEPFWRSAKQMELDLIPPALFAPFIGERFAATGRRIDDAAVALILSVTHGHPYGTQELCYFTWEATPARGRATVDTVATGLSAVLRSEDAHFTLLWDGLSAGQRVLLEALARDPGRPYTAEYRRRHRLAAPTNVQKAVAALLGREVIAKRADGTYAISEPFLAQWIARLTRDLSPIEEVGA